MAAILDERRHDHGHELGGQLRRRVHAQQLGNVQPYGRDGESDRNTRSIAGRSVRLLASAGADFIGLRWNDNSSVESGYRIERATDGVNFTFLANVPADVTTYIDTSVVSATAYSYRVRAYNAVGESLQYSNVAATQLGQLGPGVLVSYYNSPDLSGPVVLTQMPTTVDVGWGYYGSPGSGLSGGNFSGRWLGQLTASVSETFTFDADAYSTGTKVWVNDQLVYNNVDSESATNQLALLAGTKYDLKIEFRASYYYPRVRLFWSSPSTPSQIVPASALSLPPQSGLPLPANAVGPIVPVTGGGTLALNATTGDWNLAGGTIRGGTVTTSDGAQLHVTAHSGLDGVTLVNTTLDIPAGQIYVTHGLTLDGSDVRFNNTQYNGSGSPRLRFDGSQTLSGSGRVLFAGSYWGGEVTVQGGRLTIGPDVTLETAGFDGTFYDYGNGTIDNRGTIRADDGRTLTVNLPLNNRGMLQATSGGTLSLSQGELDSTGDIILNAGNIRTGQTIRLSGGSLLGTGMVQASLINSGSLLPGGASHAGELQVLGGYTQSASAILGIEIAGTDAGTLFDRLSIRDVASLNGTLIVALIDGYVWPYSGLEYSIVTYGSRQGNFAITNGLDQGAGRTFIASYGTSAFTLTSAVTDDTPRLSSAPIFRR